MSTPADQNASRGQAPTQDELNLEHYAARLERPVLMKAPDFQRGDRLRHVVFSGQFTPAMLSELAETADMIRLLSKSRGGQDFLRNLLSHRRAMLYFTQPSTRTFLSFMAACQILGITCNEVRDPSTSSETKGETRFDSIRMFSSYFDLIIMRSPVAKLAESCAYLMNDLERSGQRSVPLINAGSGADEHPTQALLDIYTLQRTFNFENPRDSPGGDKLERLRQMPGYGDLTKGLENKTYAFCGDIGRGRTVRSLAMLLAAYEGVRLVFISPDHPKLRIREDLKQRLADRGVPVYELDSFEAHLDGKPVIEQVDALYMTRVQKEHDDPEDAESMAAIDTLKYRLTPELVARMRLYTPILHPFPRDQHFGEIPPEVDDDPRAMYFRQARNGMWVRAALLAHVMDVDHAIARHFFETYRERHVYND
ncbi:Aspartate carbamoyltransferase catalytic chain [Posidoniimonas corsicana]|uniref:Aspartate carbamoyltransferase catalytic chain n=1 Tax=Posidoniimonas corsicana TaxID=1938618 RepID=A0A5C5VCV2_9BACT|nr:aspartate carbamoyltransferase [Posidoniimonas corsicana]TWT36061.1 Aspartate carbamoyltransferase catalytic chain [Posidoniimonas corsicana]